MAHEETLSLVLYFFFCTFNDRNGAGNSIAVFLSEGVQVVRVSFTAVVSIYIAMESWCPDLKVSPVIVLFV